MIPPTANHLLKVAPAKPQHLTTLPGSFPHLLCSFFSFPAGSTSARAAADRIWRIKYDNGILWPNGHQIGRGRYRWKEQDVPGADSQSGAGYVESTGWHSEMKLRWPNGGHFRSSLQALRVRVAVLRQVLLFLSNVRINNISDERCSSTVHALTFRTQKIRHVLRCYIPLLDVPVRYTCWFLVTYSCTVSRLVTEGLPFPLVSVFSKH